MVFTLSSFECSSAGGEAIRLGCLGGRCADGLAKAEVGGVVCLFPAGLARTVLLLRLCSLKLFDRDFDRRLRCEVFTQLGVHLGQSIVIFLQALNLLIE